MRRVKQILEIEDEAEDQKQKEERDGRFMIKESSTFVHSNSAKSYRKIKAIITNKIRYNL